MLTIAILVPLAGALLLAFGRSLRARTARTFAKIVGFVPLAILLVLCVRFDVNGARFQMVHEIPWIATLGIAWRTGVDGIALVVATMSALLHLAAIAYPTDTKGKAHAYYAWLLFLDGVSAGVFLTLDLVCFYVFFDLSLVGMYFLIGRWGHGDRERSALEFFLYTFAGSLVMLLGILGLALATDPLTFDMRTLIERQPLAGVGPSSYLVLGALLFGLAIKTPLVPFHTWLPSAHVDAPGPASAILAGVLLKMGTYGLIRLPLAMMRDTFAVVAPWLAVVALASIVYGALVAMGQSSLKRRIAYPSINHMGYAVLGVSVAAIEVAGAESARTLALVGATVEMVAHGLITGSLFLVTGSFLARSGTYAIDDYGGLAQRAPVLAAATVVAAFASLGLPGMAGFVAEFQVFAGTFALRPWLAAGALLGVLVTAALFLDLVQRVFFGELRGASHAFTDLESRETLVLVVLLGLVVAIGVYPGPLLERVHAAAVAFTGGS